MSKLKLRLSRSLAIKTACLLLFGCFHGTKKELTEAELIAVDERSVYAAVINARFREIGEGKVLAIADRSYAYVESKSGWSLPDRELRIGWWKERFPQAEASAAESHESKYEQPVAFTKDDFGEVRIPLQMVDESMIDQTRPVLSEKEDTSNSYGPRFEDLAPSSNGLLKISRPGFNTDRTQALIRIDYSYCPLCGFGQDLFLQKKDGVWTITDRSVVWES